MDKSLTVEEVAMLIRSRRILKEKGLAVDIDVSGICAAAGVSRKTGYQWAEKHPGPDPARQGELEAELKKLQAEREQLKKDNEWLSFENRGRKLAWEIHHVDELLAEKKSSRGWPREEKR